MNSEGIFGGFGSQALKDARRLIPQIQFSYQTIGAFVSLGDFVAIVAAALCGDFLYQHFRLNHGATPDIATGTGLIAAFIFVSLARSAHLYRLPALLAPLQNLGRFMAAWAFGLFVLTAVLFFLKVGATHSRGSFLTFSLLELPAILAMRMTAARLFTSMIARDTIAGRAAVVIGESSELEGLSAGTLLHQFGLSEIDRVILEAEARSAGNTEALHDALDKTMAIARQLAADEIVIATGWNHTDLLADITEVLRNSPLPVRLLPDQKMRSILDRRSTALTGQKWTVEIQRAPMGLIERLLKRVFDFMLATVALLVLSPILLFAALAIKFDSPGPIIFRQRRNGFNERQFVIFKFRTMRVLEDGDEIVQARRQDPRTTRVGRVLRRTSIDELPQLINVLKGDMSLVGPRPHALAHDDQYQRLIGTYCWRRHVKPGMTGWAQVNGLRGETKRLEQMQLRIEHDIWYINNWSLSLDMRILLRTFFTVLKQDAY